MTTARLPQLPLEEARAAADEAAVPNYMAELSIFQVLLNHPPLALASTTCSPPCSGTGCSTRGYASW